MLAKTLIIVTLFGFCSAAPLADAVNNTIINITSQLGDINFPNLPVNSGKQEFGEFNLTLLDVNISGVDDLVAEIIEISILPMRIKNITLHIPELLVQAQNYELSGGILFPFGDKNLALTGGDGQLRFSLIDLYFSIFIDFRSSSGKLDVSNLTLLTWASDMTFHADNFMGGDKLEWAFNTVLDDCAIVAYNYYKEALVDLIHDPLVEIINNSICKIVPFFCK